MSIAQHRVATLIFFVQLIVDDPLLGQFLQSSRRFGLHGGDVRDVRFINKNLVRQTANGQLQFAFHRLFDAGQRLQRRFDFGMVVAVLAAKRRKFQLCIDQPVLEPLQRRL